MSSIHLQRACWTNKESENPHYTFLEFIENSPFSDIDELKSQLTRCVVTEEEYQILLPLAGVLSKYKPPEGDWYAHASILQDPEWKRITEIADSSLSDFLKCSLNSDATIDQLVKTHLGSARAA